MARAGGTGVSRRTLLVGLLLVPPALAACTPAPPTPPAVLDPLIALADAARADADLAAAVVVATPALAGRVTPLHDARVQHAAALDAEILRLNPAYATPVPDTGGVTAAPDDTGSATVTPGDTTAAGTAATGDSTAGGTAAPSSSAAGGTVKATLPALRTAVAASGDAAAAAALTAATARAGLVASVAACCTAYAAALA